MSTEEGERFAKENGLIFMETSAKTAFNVEEVTPQHFPIMIFNQHVFRHSYKLLSLYTRTLTKACMTYQVRSQVSELVTKAIRLCPDKLMLTQDRSLAKKPQESKLAVDAALENLSYRIVNADVD